MFIFGNFTPEWHRVQPSIVTNDTISVMCFILVMEKLLKPANFTEQKV